MRQRGEFACSSLLGDPVQANELYAAGDYPNQSQPNEGLPQWVADDEPLEGEDIVIWYTQGVTHIPRPEEWPIMTIHRAALRLCPKDSFPKTRC